MNPTEPKSIKQLWNDDLAGRIHLKSIRADKNYFIPFFINEIEGMAYGITERSNQDVYANVTAVKLDNPIWKIETVRVTKRGVKNKELLRKLNQHYARKLTQITLFEKGKSEQDILAWKPQEKPLPKKKQRYRVKGTEVILLKGQV